jgi:hypothetical protein
VRQLVLMMVRVFGDWTDWLAVGWLAACEVVCCCCCCVSVSLRPGTSGVMLEIKENMRQCKSEDRDFKE